MPNKLWRTHPRNYGKDAHRCRVTNNARGVIRKYGLLMTRRHFREVANFIGFYKVISYFMPLNNVIIVQMRYKTPSEVHKFIKQSMCIL